jgi:hypothetical protein
MFFSGQAQGTLEDKYYLGGLSLVPSGTENQFILSADGGRNGANPENMRLNLMYGSFSLDEPLGNVCELSGGTGLSVVFAWREEDQADLGDLGITRESYGYDSNSYQYSMTFSFNEKILRSPMLTPVNSNEGVVRFCARFNTADNNANVNQRSMAVEMRVTLDGSFTLEEIDLHQVDITADTGDEAFFGVSADNCGDNLVYLPGEPVCIRVCANNYPATSIVDFVEMPLAYISGSAIDPSVSVTQDITGCVGGTTGVQCCEIQTLLYKNEYPTVFGETTSKIFSGTVTLAMGAGTPPPTVGGLGRFAGAYNAQLMYGGWGGTWGNGGAMSFTITCDGEIIITADGTTTVNALVTDFTFEGIDLNFFMPIGDTERWVRASVGATLQSSYHFRPSSQWPNNVCEGGCMTGVYDPRGGSGLIDFRAHAPSLTDWYVHLVPFLGVKFFGMHF